MGPIFLPAAPGDYTAQISVALTFMPGSSSACITIPIEDDSDDELTETFTVSAVSSNTDSIAVTGRSSAEVCIDDDDCKFRFRQRNS